MSAPFCYRLFSLLATLLLASCAAPPARYAMVIGLKPERLAEYRRLHADPWQGVLDQLDRCNVRDYSIWLVELRPGEPYLFGSFEYTGDDFDADMARMGEDETTQLWWRETAPCQQPIPSAAPGEQWTMLQEIFYHDGRFPGADRMPAPRAVDVGRADGAEAVQR